jgi:hypothetical protein
MSTVDSSSNNPAYIAAINASEMQRQSEEGAVYQKYGIVGGRFAFSVSGSEGAAVATAVKTAAVSDLKRRLAICSQFGQPDGAIRDALFTILGTNYF